MERKMSACQEEEVKLSAFQLLAGLMRLAGARTMQDGISRLLPVFPLLPVCLAMGDRAWSAYLSTGSPSEAVTRGLCLRSPIMVLFVVSTAYIQYFIWRTLLAFILTCVFHYKRLRVVLQCLALFARPCFATHPNLPQLQVDGPHAAQNVRVLVACFEMAIAFGHRYKKRMDYYAVFILGSVLAGLLCMVLEVILEPSQMHSCDDDAAASVDEAPLDKSHALPLSRSMIITIYMSCVMTGMFYVLCANGDVANKGFKCLANSIQSARWRMKSHGFEGVSSLSAEDDELLALCAERLGSLEEAQPVSLAGMTLSKDLGNSVMSGAVTGIAYILTRKLGLNIPI